MQSLFCDVSVLSKKTCKIPSYIPTVTECFLYMLEHCFVQHTYTAIDTHIGLHCKPGKSVSLRLNNRRNRTCLNPTPTFLRTLLWERNRTKCECFIRVGWLGVEKKGWILMCFSSAFVFAFVWEDALFPLHVHILLYTPSAQSMFHGNDLTLPKQTSWTRHAWFDVQRQLPCHSLACWQTEMRVFMKERPNGPSSSSRHPPCTLISVLSSWWRDLWSHFKGLLLFLLDYKCFLFYMHLYPLGNNKHIHTHTPAAQYLIHTQLPNTLQLHINFTSSPFLGHSSFEKYSWSVWVSAFLPVQQGFLYSLLDSGEPSKWPRHLH